MTSPEAEGRRAAIIGIGLIGGSLGLALRQRGWYVTGRDRDAGRAARAVELGALDAVGDDLDAEIVFVATPLTAVVEEARKALAAGALVTDVAGVKGPVTSAIDHPRFVGGHPMAGSEQEGVDGAEGSLFAGATWVLTPTEHTDPEAYARVRSVITSLGADVVALPPHRHDALVAVVSHVPHLAAVSLMRLAAAEGVEEGVEEDRALFRLAAGGFRDMTRVASGHPGIWPDICAENRDAIVEALDGLLGHLGALRDLVGRGDRPALLRELERARATRLRLPGPTERGSDLAELRVPVLNRPGVLAEITTLAGEMDVNIEAFDIEPGGPSGVLVMVLRSEAADRVASALSERGYRPTARPVE